MASHYPACLCCVARLKAELSSLGGRVVARDGVYVV